MPSNFKVYCFNEYLGDNLELIEQVFWICIQIFVVVGEIGEGLGDPVDEPESSFVDVSCHTGKSSKAVVELAAIG